MFENVGHMQDNFANLRTFKDIVGHQIQFKDIVDTMSWITKDS